MGREEDTAAREAAEVAARSQRNTTLLIARCERADGTTVAIRVRNISDTGLKGESTGVVDFDLDEPVKIRFANLSPIAAQVVRYAANEIGIRFLRKVDVQQLVAVRAAGAPLESSPRSEAVSQWIDLNARLQRNKQGAVRSAV